MKHSRRKDEGIALMLTVFALIVILGAVVVVTHRAHTAKRMTDFSVASAELQEACLAGIDVAVERYWHQYTVNQGNTTGNLASYFAWIDNFSEGQVQTNEDVNHNGGQDGDEWDANGNGQFDINPPLYIVNPEGDPMSLESGSRITDLSVERFDDVTGTNLTIRVTAEKSGQTQSAVQTIRVAGELFQGFEFAVLANNINCILCHADFYNLDLNQNADPANYGTYDRIKIAALESLLIRPTEAYSNVCGTTYTRGRVYNSSGAELSASAVAGSTMKAWPFNSDDGKIQQNTDGSLKNVVSLQNAGTDAEGRPDQFANLYLDYPDEEASMTDGNLPASFPAPFPDDDGDRTISDTEFDRVMNSANGYIQFEMDPGESGGIQGGVAYGVPEGSSFSGTALPTASNEALTALSDTGYYDGNLILVGNDADPIVIDDKVAVNGDLVIKGPIKGWGQILVRGNTYIVGDITYADGGTFGVAGDGTENGFALTTGGSIMIGDYTTIRAKNNMKSGSPDYVDPYVWQGHFTRVDKETYSQKMSNGKYTQVGYFDPGVVDAGWAQGAEGQYSFTTSELMLSNRMEHLKAEADPSYTPRYYALRDTAPVYEYVLEDVTDSNLYEHSVSYLCPGVETIDDLSGATVHTLNPKDYWLTEDQLRRFWWADEAQRRAKGGRQPWKFDGLLYSNNCIFSVVRSYGRHKSQCYGTLNVRGSIVCADLGVLMIDTSYASTTGLNLEYDRRVADFLRVEDTTQVELRRVALLWE